MRAAEDGNCLRAASWGVAWGSKLCIEEVNESSVRNFGCLEALMFPRRARTRLEVLLPSSGAFNRSKALFPGDPPANSYLELDAMSYNEIMVQYLPYDKLE